MDGVASEKGANTTGARCFRAIEAEVYAYAVRLPRFAAFLRPSRLS
jgi:hypothetical protein